MVYYLSLFFKLFCEFSFEFLSMNLNDLVLIFFWVRGHPGIEVFIQDQVQVLIYFLKAEKLVVGLVVFSEAWSA